MDTSSTVELIRFGDESQHLSVVVLGRHTPGVLNLHDILRAEIIVETGIGTLRLATTIASSDVDDWERALDLLADDEPVSWLGDRCPEIEIGPGDGTGFWRATVSDPAQSGVIVQIPITIDEADSHSRLEDLRRAYPSEVVATSPGAYQWRSPR
ncbi:hypothetical protein ABH935_006642 [Catenulispora sp. GAS73]|uniref:DUF5959 family protein n=1 Tax=Catenulispora sp. GAS73 TaxID=3156269 RepID=UPI0035149F7F